VSDANVLSGDEVERDREEAGENDGIDPGGRTIRARGRWNWLGNLIRGRRSRS
jgi:hypothetical protein